MNPLTKIRKTIRTGDFGFSIESGKVIKQHSELTCKYYDNTYLLEEHEIKMKIKLPALSRVAYTLLKP